MKFPIIFLLRSALLLVALVGSKGHAATDYAAVMALSGSVLQVEALRAQGGFSLGSAVVVGPEEIVTNCHVTRDAMKVNVLRGGGRWLAEAQFSDVDHDLCLLRVPGLRADTVRIGRADALKIGQPVTALGYTYGGMQNSEGEVLALHRLDGSSVIQSTNWFSSGASGGGLFDQDLRLVGILTFRLRGGEAHYFAAPAEWLSNMLDRASADSYRPVTPLDPARLAYWQQPAQAQPAFLKAAVLQRDDQWAGLESLTLEWARADAADPEAWYLMGLALERLDRLAQAQHALECALRIAPDFAPASSRLATLQRQPDSNDRAPGAPAGPASAASAASAPAASMACDANTSTATSRNQ